MILGVSVDQIGIWRALLIVLKSAQISHCAKQKRIFHQAKGRKKDAQPGSFFFSLGDSMDAP